MRKMLQLTRLQLSPEHPAVRFLSGRLLALGLILAVIAVSVGSVTYAWSASIKTLFAVGVIEQVNGATQIVISRYDASDLKLKLPTDVAIIKNKARAHISGLEAGDTVRITYVSRLIGVPVAEVVRATSPFVSGRVVGIDLEERTISIMAETIHKFEVRDQTVILRNGSLAHLYDLKLGSRAKAEYRNVPQMQLELLLIND